MSGNDRPQIRKKLKDRIKKIFLADLTFLLGNAAVEMGIHHMSICRLVNEDLKLFPYKDTIESRLNDEIKSEGTDFAHYCHNRLQNDS